MLGGRITSVTVTVVQARGLPAADWGSKSDPYCKVSIGKVSHETKCINKTLEPVWNERFVFPAGDNDNISFEVWDKDLITSDFLGSCTVSIQKMGLQQQIEAEHWLPLYDKSMKPAGELLVVFSAEFEAGVISSSNLVAITVLRAEGLPKMDMLGQADPYVVLKIGKTEKRTSAKTKTLTPEWNETFTLTVHETDVLEISCFDQDVVGSDLIGQAQLEGGDVLRNLQSDLVIPLYNKNKAAGQIILGFDPGSLDESPVVSTNAGKDTTILTIRVVSANHLPSEPSAYVQLSFGDKKHTTSTKSSSSNPIWDEDFVFDIGAEDHIDVKVYDKGYISSSLVGQTTLNGNALIAASRLEQYFESPLVDQSEKHSAGAIVLNVFGPGAVIPPPSSKEKPAPSQAPSSAPAKPASKPASTQPPNQPTSNHQPVTVKQQQSQGQASYKATTPRSQQPTSGAPQTVVYVEDQAHSYGAQGLVSLTPRDYPTSLNNQTSIQQQLDLQGQVRDIGLGYGAQQNVNGFSVQQANGQFNSAFGNQNAALINAQQQQQSLLGNSVAQQQLLLQQQQLFNQSQFGATGAAGAINGVNTLAAGTGFGGPIGGLNAQAGLAANGFGNQFGGLGALGGAQFGALNNLGGIGALGGVNALAGLGGVGLGNGFGGLTGLGATGNGLNVGGIGGLGALAGAGGIGGLGLAGGLGALGGLGAVGNGLGVGGGLGGLGLGALGLAGAGGLGQLSGQAGLLGGLLGGITHELLDIVIRIISVERLTAGSPADVYIALSLADDVQRSSSRPPPYIWNENLAFLGKLLDVLTIQVCAVIPELEDPVVGQAQVPVSQLIQASLSGQHLEVTVRSLQGQGTGVIYLAADAAPFENLELPFERPLRTLSTHREYPVTETVIYEGPPRHSLTSTSTIGAVAATSYVRQAPLALDAADGVIDGRYFGQRIVSQTPAYTETAPVSYSRVEPTSYVTTAAPSSPIRTGSSRVVEGRRTGRILSKRVVGQPTRRVVAERVISG